MRYLIINADDFGITAHANAAVQQAHREGVLNSASLMVNEPGFAEAVEIAKGTPSLGVGLHVVTTTDRALLSAAEAPRIVGQDGKFGADPFRVGVKYAFSKSAQAELKREMAAQFERFARTGIPWSHADGHQHFHLHPVVWQLFLELCDEYGVHRIRIPHEEVRAHLRSGGDGPNLNTIGLLALRLARRRCLRLLRERGTLGGRPAFFCERVYGTLQSADMHTEYVVSLLDRLGGRTNEIHCHPGTAYAFRLPAGEQEGDVRDVEHKMLSAPAVRAKIDALGLCTGRYEDVENALRKPRA